MWGVRALTDSDFALLTLVIGLIVGGAVRIGAERRGGWFYQLLAIVLTYVSIAASMAPDLAEVFRADAWAESESEVAMIEERAREMLEAQGDLPEGVPEEVDPAPAAPDETTDAAAGVPPDGGPANSDAFPPETSGAVPETTAEELPEGLPDDVDPILFWLFVGIVSLAAPVLVSFESPIMGIIVLIGLWEAWRMNRKTVVPFTGPHAVGASPPSPDAPAGA